MRIETITFEYEHCGECPEVDYQNGKYRCTKTNRTAKEIWGEIPKWCPLEEKKDD